MLKERATYYYIEENKNCAVAMFQAANDVYGLGLTEDTAALFTGFGGGMGYGITCGALSGAIGAIGAKYKGMDRETSHALCTGLVEKFKEKLACGSVDCSVIAAQYKVPETRCLKAVLLGAEALEEFIAEWEAKECAK